MEDQSKIHAHEVPNMTMKGLLYKYFIFIIVLILIVSCDATNIFKPRSNSHGTKISGIYWSAFEVSALYPCGSDEVWWLIGSEEFYQRYWDLRLQTYERAFVRLHGIRSKLGHYGHLGGYDREFKVSRVIEIRKSSDTDCIH